MFGIKSHSYKIGNSLNNPKKIWIMENIVLLKHVLISLKFSEFLELRNQFAPSSRAS